MSSTVAPSHTGPMFVHILSSMASLRVAALVNCLTLIYTNSDY